MHIEMCILLHVVVSMLIGILAVFHHVVDVIVVISIVVMLVVWRTKSAPGGGIRDDIVLP